MVAQPGQKWELKIHGGASVKTIAGEKGCEATRLGDPDTHRPAPANGFRRAAIGGLVNPGVGYGWQV